MDFENNEGFEDNSVYGKKINYFITYKSKVNGSMGIVTTSATSKSEIEKLFNEKLPNYEIFKTRSSYEFVKDFGNETAINLMKHFKTIDSLVEKKFVIDSNKTRKIDYSSKSFLKGLKKINEKIKKSKELSKPDSEKKHLRFNI